MTGYLAKAALCLVISHLAVLQTGLGAQATVEVHRPERNLVVDRGPVRVYASDPDMTRYSLAAEGASLREIQEAVRRAGIPLPHVPAVGEPLTLTIKSASYWELMLSIARASKTRISGSGLVAPDSRTRVFRSLDPYAVALAIGGPTPSIEVYPNMEDSSGLPFTITLLGVRGDGVEELLGLRELNDSDCIRYAIESEVKDYVRLKCTLVGYPVVKAMHLVGRTGTQLDLEAEKLSIQFASVPDMVADLAADRDCVVLSYERKPLDKASRQSYEGWVLPVGLRVTDADGRVVKARGVGGYGNDGRGVLHAYAVTDFGTPDPFGSLDPASWASLETTLKITGKRTWTVEFPLD